MCGRQILHDSLIVQLIMEKIGLPFFPERPSRYNIKQTTNMDVVFNQAELVEMQWSIEFGKFRHPNTKEILFVPLDFNPRKMPESYRYRDITSS